jgi:hypothetical protein
MNPRARRPPPARATTLALALSSLAPLGCAPSGREPHRAPEAPSLEARATERGATRLAGRHVELELPARDGAIVLRDRRSSMRLALTLRGASSERLGRALGPPGATSYDDSPAPGQRHEVHPIEGGLEDLVHLPTRPEREELSYELDLTDVAGLRLLAGALELLDERGAPRLRAAPPFVLDAHGARHPATLELPDCPFDGDARPPWGRPTTRPPPRCTLTVRWGAAGRPLSYPIVVDPAWTSTASMMAPRGFHTASLVLGRVLVWGGDDGGAPAELFDPASDTWAIAGQPTLPRRYHTAVSTGDSGARAGRHRPRRGGRHRRDRALRRREWRVRGGGRHARAAHLPHLHAAARRPRAHRGWHRSALLARDRRRVVLGGRAVRPRDAHDLVGRRREPAARTHGHPALQRPRAGGRRGHLRAEHQRSRAAHGLVGAVRAEHGRVFASGRDAPRARRAPHARPARRASPRAGRVAERARAGDGDRDLRPGDLDLDAHRWTARAHAAELDRGAHGERRGARGRRLLRHRHDRDLLATRRHLEPRRAPARAQHRPHEHAVARRPRAARGWARRPRQPPRPEPPARSLPARRALGQPRGVQERARVERRVLRRAVRGELRELPRQREGPRPRRHLRASGPRRARPQGGLRRRAGPELRRHRPLHRERGVRALRGRHHLRHHRLHVRGGAVRRRGRLRMPTPRVQRRPAILWRRRLRPLQVRRRRLPLDVRLVRRVPRALPLRSHEPLRAAHHGLERGGGLLAVRAARWARRALGRAPRAALAGAARHVGEAQARPDGEQVPLLPAPCSRRWGRPTLGCSAAPSGGRARSGLGARPHRAQRSTPASSAASTTAWAQQRRSSHSRPCGARARPSPCPRAPRARSGCARRTWACASCSHRPGPRPRAPKGRTPPTRGRSARRPRCGCARPATGSKTTCASTSVPTERTFATWSTCPRPRGCGSWATCSSSSTRAARPACGWRPPTCSTRAAPGATRASPWPTAPTTPTPRRPGGEASHRPRPLVVRAGRELPRRGARLPGHGRPAVGAHLVARHREDEPPGHRRGRRATRGQGRGHGRHEPRQHRRW